MLLSHVGDLPADGILRDTHTLAHVDDHLAFCGLWVYAHLILLTCINSPPPYLHEQT